MTTTRPASTLNDPGFGTDPTRTGYPERPIGSGAATENPHPLAEAGQQVGESAGEIAGRAKEIGFTQADRGRELAADGLTKLAQTMRRASQDVQDQPMAANVASTVADQTERAASYLRQTDARQMVSNVEGFARKSPLLFLGGALVLGAIASRFIKAAGGAPESTSIAKSEVPGYGSNRRLTADGFAATGPGSVATGSFDRGA